MAQDKTSPGRCPTCGRIPLQVTSESDYQAGFAYSCLGRPAVQPHGGRQRCCPMCGVVPGGYHHATCGQPLAAAK